MAGGWTMGCSGWLVVLVLVSGFRTGLGDISVTMKKMVEGYKGKSVVIPCTYTTSSNEEIVKIEWKFKSQPVIFRAESEDHILHVKYRNRATISKSPAGNVALTLKNLDMDDKGKFKCKITGRENSGKLITQEDITILKVFKKKKASPVTEKPIDITEEDVSGKNFVTETPYMETEPTAWQDDNANNIATDPSDMETETTARQDVNTRTFITITPEVSSIGKEPALSTESIVTETPVMKTEMTAAWDVTTKIIVTETPEMKIARTPWRDVNRRTFITTNPHVKVTSVGKDPDLNPEISVSSTGDRDKEIIPTKNSQIVTEKTKTSNMETATTTRRDVNTKLLTTKPDVKASRSGREMDKTTGATRVRDDSTIVNTKQPRRFHSSTIPVVPFTTNVMHNVPESEAIKGSGIFFYVLIIGLLCIIFVLILVIVLIARRKKRKSVIFNIPTMNQLALNLEERSCGGGGCQSSVDPASNDYESCFPVSQYESLPCPSNEYEQLLIKNPEGNDIHCEPSEQSAQSFKL